MMKYIHIAIISAFLFYACSSSYEIATIEDSQQKFTTLYKKEDALIEARILPYREQLENSMGEVIAVAAIDMSKAQPESTLGNLLSDATQEMASVYSSDKNIDAAIINYGGIRVPGINKGEITLGNVFEIMPFDNYLVVVELKGEVLQEVCNVIAAKGGWPVAGINFKIKDGKAEDVHVASKQLDLSKTYRIAISDYLAGGGDNLAMLKTLPYENTNILLRDAFILYFKQKKVLNAKLENRISYE